MNWRRGLFRLWIVGSALFVIAVASLNYTDIKEEFDDAASVTLKPMTEFRTLKPVTDPTLIKRLERCDSWDVGGHCMRHSASGATSWIIPGVGFLWVRC
jgi:hypothetical protein